MSNHWSESEQCYDGVSYSGAHRVTSRNLVKAVQLRQTRWSWLLKMAQKLNTANANRTALKLAPEATAVCIDCAHGQHGIPGPHFQSGDLTKGCGYFCQCACHKG